MGNLTLDDWFTAVSDGDIFKINVMFGKYACSRDSNGDTALLRAVRAENEALVKLLLAKEGEMVNKNGFGALLLAAQLDHTRIAVLLMKVMPDQTTPDGMNALMVAAANSSINTAQAIISHFNNVADDNGLFAVNHAVSSGSLEMVKLICKRFPPEGDILHKALSIARVAAYVEITHYLESFLQPAPAPCTISSIGPSVSLSSSNVSAPFGAMISELHGAHASVINDMRDQLNQMNVSISRLAEPNSVSESSLLSTLLLSTGGAPVDTWASLNSAPQFLDALTGAAVLTTDNGTIITAGELLKELSSLHEELEKKDLALARQGMEVEALREQLKQLAHKTGSTNLSDLLSHFDQRLSQGSAEGSLPLPAEQELLSELKQHINSLAVSADSLALKYVSTKLPAHATTASDQQLEADMHELNQHTEDALETIDMLQGSPSSGYDGSPLGIDGACLRASELTPLMRAVISGKNPDLARMQDFVGKTTSDGTTALMIAVQCGNINAVAALSSLEAGIARADAKTALSLAIHADFYDAIRILLPLEGIDVSQNNVIATDNQKNPLLLSAEQGDVVAVYCYRKVFARLHDERGQTALMRAATVGEEKVVDLLVDYECGMQTPKGVTALMLAAQHGHVGCIERLLPQERALRDSDGNDALHYATRLAQYDRTDTKLYDFLVSLLSENNDAVS